MQIKTNLSASTYIKVKTKIMYIQSLLLWILSILKMKNHNFQHESNCKMDKTAEEQEMHQLHRKHVVAKSIIF
jgi:hypothetical protein